MLACWHVWSGAGAVEQKTDYLVERDAGSHGILEGPVSYPKLRLQTALCTHAVLQSPGHSFIDFRRVLVFGTEISLCINQFVLNCTDTRHYEPLDLCYILSLAQLSLAKNASASLAAGHACVQTRYCTLNDLFLLNNPMYFWFSEHETCRVLIYGCSY